MIRVNLLPRRREAKREGGKAWIVFLAAAFLAEIIGIAVIHANARTKLEGQNEQNRGLEAGIAEKKSKVANHEQIKKELAEYIAREDAIGKLLAAKTGPTSMMLEMSKILTPRRMPTVDPEALERVRRDNPTLMPNEKWDPKRLWILSFRENARVVSLTGTGKTNDDVAEFLRRMAISKYFDEVRLVRTEERNERDPSTAATIQTVYFDLRAKVRY
jgi:type IV pilus assembly protein PilN